MRIVGGSWRGKALVAPAGQTTRPTADRVRQSLFDMLLHAPWADRLLEGAQVLDGFAGTGALGLEALSRGAAQASFMEQDRAALAALRANIAACRAEARTRLLAVDATAPPRAAVPCGLIFLDPPYGGDFGPRAVAALRRAGWLAERAVIVLELGRTEERPELGTLLADRRHGAARITVWRS